MNELCSAKARDDNCRIQLVLIESENTSGAYLE